MKNENLCSEVISLQIKNKTTGIKNSSIMLMQKEEIESYQREMFDLRKTFMNLNNKYKTLLIKFKKTKVENTCKMAVLDSKHLALFP